MWWNNPYELESHLSTVPGSFEWRKTSPALNNDLASGTCIKGSCPSYVCTLRLLTDVSRWVPTKRGYPARISRDDVERGPNHYGFSFVPLTAFTACLPFETRNIYQDNYQSSNILTKSIHCSINKVES